MTFREEIALFKRQPQPYDWNGEPYSDIETKQVVYLQEHNIDGYDAPCFRYESQEDFSLDLKNKKDLI